MIFDFLKRRRRRRILSRPMPEQWRRVLAEGTPFHSRMPADQRAELEDLTRIFLAEKTFEACGGMDVDDSVRVTIAGLACQLLVGRDTDVYPLLHSVLVYPDTFVVDVEYEDENGLLVSETEERLGESWEKGSLVLSWKDIERDLAAPAEGYNVVLHEFAHQIDDESGDTDGMPQLDDAEAAAAWAGVMGREFAALNRAVDRGKSTLIDEYAAESPTEFFAVVTELFFGAPRRLTARHPDIYAQLRDFYRQDPAGWAVGA